MEDFKAIKICPDKTGARRGLLFQNSALTMKGAKNQLGDGYRICSRSN